jgi:archaellum component FlaC
MKYFQIFEMVEMIGNIYTHIINNLNAQHLGVKKWTHEITNFVQILKEPMKPINS